MAFVIIWLTPVFISNDYNMNAFDPKYTIPENRSILEKPAKKCLAVMLKEKKADQAASNQFQRLNEILLTWKEVIMKNKFVCKYVQLLNQNNSFNL
jgi:hypothetical protein